MFTKEQILKALKESTEDQMKVYNKNWLTRKMFMLAVKL